MPLPTTSSILETSTSALQPNALPYLTITRFATAERICLRRFCAIARDACHSSVKSDFSHQRRQDSSLPPQPLKVKQGHRKKSTEPVELPRMHLKPAPPHRVESSGWRSGKPSSTVSPKSALLDGAYRPSYRIVAAGAIASVAGFYFLSPGSSSKTGQAMYERNLSMNIMFSLAMICG